MAEQRLIVCLDGTWNRQDSSTNVLHHFNVVHEGLDPETGLVQKKYYHTGVGTGVLDSFTGGGFGFGLEQNVRDAYNWLVENYCDRKPPERPDEIYIFGFSRGAYTARSLVGFIGQCGLLRRGAPITVSQLWRDYCILGRQKEERRSVWDKLFWKVEAKIRPITELTPDPWSKQQTRADALNPNEQLLVRWSRRVRITYLGIYDTVGAIGWDALAVPGLTSRMALHNNMRPTTLIQHCRHALALDEHRSSFQHTPFLAFIGYDLAETERGEDSPGDAALDARQYWDRTRAMWQRKIEQRWFVGAHSNIGGGYESNRLAQKPFHWILEGATQLGLAADLVADDGPVTRTDQTPRDSYAEFAPPLWTRIIRAKRNYRAIDPEPRPQASSKKTPGGIPHAGFSLETIHESVDPTVFQYWANSPVAVPPNLQAYADRTRQTIPATAPAKHIWLDETVSAYVSLVMWAVLAAAGLLAVDRATGLIPVHTGLWVGCVLAFLLPVVDWSESLMNFRCSLGRAGPRERAFLDAVYWARALGFVLCVFGAVRAATALPELGWSHAFGRVTALAAVFWPVPVCAALAAIFFTRLRSKAAWISLAAGPLTAGVAGGALVGLGWLASILFPEYYRPAPNVAPSPVSRSVPGLLLLLQLSLIYFWRALAWTSEPMAKANLGSIVPLQRCLTPSKVAACLERWRSMLENRWLQEDLVQGPAAVRMRELLGQSLWRDMIGFIPVYSLVLLYGLWFASRYLPAFAFLKQPGGGLAWWWLLPLVAAVTDYLEDAAHLRFCRLHAIGQAPSPVLTFFSWSISRLKNVSVLASALTLIAAVYAGTWAASKDLADWRAKIAVFLTSAFTATVLAGIAVRLGHMFRVRRKRPSERPPQATAAEA